MSDMTLTTAPKVDQLTFDHFAGGVERTIKITSVDLTPGVDQPCVVHYEGENGLPYKPGLSMRRVMVHVWGKETSTYVGHSLKLYGDPTVKFGGLALGGIRISHMTGIQKPVTMALTLTKANKKPFTVKPLIFEAVESIDQEKLLNDSDVAANLGIEAYKAFFSALGKAERAFLLPRHEDLKKRAMEADQQHAGEPVDEGDTE
jgi:hypothetical protein